MGGGAVNVGRAEFYLYQRVLVPKKEKERNVDFYKELPRLINQTAKQIREDWNSIPLENKKDLIELYLYLIGEKRGTILDWLKGFVFLKRAKIRFGSDYVSRLNDALANLKYALTDLVEAHNPQYIKDVNQCIKEALSGERKVLTDATLEEWFREMDN